MTASTDCPARLLMFMVCVAAQHDEYIEDRPYDGYFNNFAHPDWGASGKSLESIDGTGFFWGGGSALRNMMSSLNSARDFISQLGSKKCGGWRGQPNYLCLCRCVCVCGGGGGSPASLFRPLRIVPIIER